MRRLRVLPFAGALAAGASVAFLASPAGAAPAPTVTVREGETLSEVALRHGVGVPALAAANGIADAGRVRAGTRLRVPTRSTASGSGAALPVRLRSSPQRLALAPVFDRWAAAYGVPADLLKAATWQESGWQNSVVSSVGARGIGQLMPDTVTFVNDRLLGAQLDPARPSDNIRLSARFMRYLLDRSGGDARFALGSYYQGLASMRRSGPASGTRAYVDDVLALRRRF